MLKDLADKGLVVFTPSREVDNQRITSYDDTFVLDYAVKHGGVVITRDNYKDLVNVSAAVTVLVTNPSPGKARVARGGPPEDPHAYIRGGGRPDVAPRPPGSGRTLARPVPQILKCDLTLVDAVI